MTIAGTQLPRRASIVGTLRGEGLTGVEFASVVGRLGSCLWSSTALLFVAGRFGVGVAGYAVAAFTISSAVSAAPLCAILVGENVFGVPVVLTLNASSAALLITAGNRQVVFAVCGTALAGASAPPTAAVMRSIWTAHPPAVGVSRVLAAESLVTQICLVVSPAVVGSVAAGPARMAAPVTAAGCVCGGNAVMRARNPRRLTDAGRAGSADAGRRRRVNSRLLVIFAVIGASAMVSGFFNISVAYRFASRPQFPDSAGTVIAAAATGSIVGGLLFARFWRSSGTRWGYPVLLGFWAVALWLLAATGHGYLAIAVAFLTGSPVAGIGAEEFALLGQADRRRSAWLFGLANTAIRAGVGIGAVACAQLLRQFPAAGRVMPAVAATVVLGLSVVAWPWLVGTASAPAPTDGRLVERR